MRDINVYFSCPLTGMSEEYKSEAFSVREQIRAIPGVTILDFCEPKPGQIQSDLDDGDVYHNDIHECVAKADAIIAILPGSFGVGYELGVGIEKFHIPTLMCAQSGVPISKIAKGSALRNNHVSLTSYYTLSDVVEYATLFLEGIVVDQE